MRPRHARGGDDRELRFASHIMLLTPPEAKLYFKLHWALMFFVNERVRVLPEKLSSPEEVPLQSPDAVRQIRDRLLANAELIEAFVRENPAQFDREELDVVDSWRHYEFGHFFIFRELKKYTVFLACGKDPVAYGVTALTHPFEELTGPYLPVGTETMLLPFRDKIIYDGILVSPGPRITFGPGIRRMLNDDYRRAKQRYGIVTSLPLGGVGSRK